MYEALSYWCMRPYAVVRRAVYASFRCCVCGFKVLYSVCGLKVLCGAQVLPTALMRRTRSGCIRYPVSLYLKKKILLKKEISTPRSYLWLLISSYLAFRCGRGEEPYDMLLCGR